MNILQGLIDCGLLDKFIMALGCTILTSIIKKAVIERAACTKGRKSIAAKKRYRCWEGSKDVISVLILIIEGVALHYLFDLDVKSVALVLFMAIITYHIGLKTVLTAIGSRQAGGNNEGK